MKTLPLNENVTVKLDVSGNGSARLGPNGHGVTWRPEVASVRASRPIVKEATAEIYVGSTATQDNYVDSTFTGSSGDSSDSVKSTYISLGAFIWAVWTGGDVGSQATLTVTGTQEVN